MRKISKFKVLLMAIIIFAISFSEIKGIAKSELLIERRNIVDADLSIGNKEKLELYTKFLEGEISVYCGDSELYIADIISSEKDQKNDYNARYVLFDSNNDRRDELHIRSQNHYYILSYCNNDLYVWAELTPYYEQLNNGAFLHTRSGGTPSHICYRYITMDYSGNELMNISFEKYDVDENGVYGNEDRYFYEDIEISLQDWIQLTEKYLETASDKIEWVSL